MTPGAPNDNRGAQSPQGRPVTQGPMTPEAPIDPGGRPVTPRALIIYNICSTIRRVLVWNWHRSIWHGTGALLVGIESTAFGIGVRGVLNIHETESMESQSYHSNTLHVSQEWRRKLVPFLVLVTGRNEKYDIFKSFLAEPWMESENATLCRAT